MLRLTLAWLHLLALGIGLGAVWARRAALLERPLTAAAARRAFAADGWWGAAAALWLSTGLWRLFAATEKSTEYYLRSSAFHTKLGLFALILLLEAWPMVMLMRWRSAARRDPERWTPDERAATRIAHLSALEVMLVVIIVLSAVGMARGYGARG